jgi:hypothetical protein
MDKPTILRHKLRCNRSGLLIGTLDLNMTAGALPYLSHWNGCIAWHPVFSLEPGKLFTFVENEWERLAVRVGDTEITDDEANILRVGYLAVLYTLDCIKQEEPALPPLAMVYSTMQRLFNLAIWKWKLESLRFRFPTLHISRFNQNLDFSNMPDYLNLCFDIKRGYETGVREADEKEKVLAAERAMIALTRTWITPTNKKMLWNWVRAHLVEGKYAPDAQGWLATLFLGGSAAIIEFEEEDINLAEEIVVSSCPAGTGIMYAVRQRLDFIKQVWKQHHAAYEINVEDYAPGANLYVNGERVECPDPGPEPVASNFDSKAKYFVAHAKWSIANTAFNKQQRRKENGKSETA